MVVSVAAAMGGTTASSHYSPSMVNLIVDRCRGAESSDPVDVLPGITADSEISEMYVLP